MGKTIWLPVYCKPQVGICPRLGLGEKIIVQVQITLVSKSGYRPLSTLIEVESWEAYQQNKQAYQQKAVTSILAKRHMTIRDVRRYGYTQIKARVYDKERIARENAERYEKLKKEKGWA